MLNGLVLQPDIAVLGMGSDDIWDPHRATHWSSIQQQEAPQLVRMLRRVVSRPAPPLLYWRTLTPNCATLNFSVKKTEQTNTLLAQASTRLVSALCSQRASTGEAAIPALQILDKWSWVLPVDANPMTTCTIQSWRSPTCARY